MTEYERLPLTGLRVVDMTEVWAGPMTASYLADWGAEVIRVESFPRAETMRPVAARPGGLGFSDNDPQLPAPWERFARRFVANHSKRGITLNLRDPNGSALLRELLTITDVLVENYASETLPRLGLGWDTVHTLNPHIIMLSVSGWGGGGPYAGYTAMGSGVDATTGHAILRGYADEDPTHTNQGYQSDAVAPLHGVLAVAAALNERARTGEGRRIELSEAEGLLTTLARNVVDASLNGRPGSRVENDHPWAAPHGCFPCREVDRWITIAVETNAQWQALCTVLAAHDLSKSAQYASPSGRWGDRATLEAKLAGFTVQWDDEELMEALQAAGVPAGAVYDEQNVMQDPHLRARGFWVETDHPIVGRRTYPRTPWRFDWRDPAAYRPANRLGEDNEWVLKSLLGRSPAEIKRLTDDAVIGTAYQ